MYVKSRKNDAAKKINNSINRPVELNQRKYSTLIATKKKSSPKLIKSSPPFINFWV